jgi:hypothetical protein
LMRRISMQMTLVMTAMMSRVTKTPTRKLS